eukprot:jgi/Galph1/2832/GphlegSOOS_G1519.1
MSTFMKSNIFSILSDDAEDPKVPSSVTSSNSVVKIPHIESLPTAEVEAEDTVEEHHVPLPKKHGREFDRHSGTGRGKEISKSGSGGKYVFGNPEEEARKVTDGVNTALHLGLKDDEAIRMVEERAVKDELGEEETTAQQVQQEEEPKEVLTLDEYLARQAERKLEVTKLLDRKPRKVKEEETTIDKNWKPLRRDAEEDPTLIGIGQKNVQHGNGSNNLNNSNNNNSRSKENKNKTMDRTREFFSELPSRRGRGRGRGFGQRGGGRRGGFRQNEENIKTKEQSNADDNVDNKDRKEESREYNGRGNNRLSPSYRGKFRGSIRGRKNNCSTKYF